MGKFFWGLGFTEFEFYGLNLARVEFGCNDFVFMHGLSLVG